MAKAKTQVATRRRKHRLLKAAKGYRGARARLYRTAQETVMRAQAFAYRDRKIKKRNLRMLWIARINAACKQCGIKYSQFINALKKAKVTLDRKTIADLAVSNKAAFNRLAEMVREKITPSAGPKRQTKSKR